VTTVAVIPARGGSKRIPRKNVRLFGGRPIIAYSIDAAASSGCFDRVVVSTDCEQIADVAVACGAEVPFIRPGELSNDVAPTISVIRHALMKLGSKNSDVACCIYATAPFITREDLLRGRDVLRSSGADFAVSVTTFPYPIQRALRLKEDGRISMFEPNSMFVRSQDLEDAYHDAAQFYWGTAEAFLTERPIFGSGTIPVIIPRHRVQDIDTEEDWIRAEAMQCAHFHLESSHADYIPR
jgi:pseudaminic acid cytidylyltransferase